MINPIKTFTSRHATKWDKLIHASDTFHSKQLRISTENSPWGFVVTVQGSENVIDQDPTGGRLVCISFPGFYSKSGLRKFSWPGNLRWKGYRFKSHTDVLGQYMSKLPMLLRIIVTFGRALRRNDISTLMLHILFVYIGEIFAACSSFHLTKSLSWLPWKPWLMVIFFDFLHIATYGYIITLIPFWSSLILSLLWYTCYISLIISKISQLLVNHQPKLSKYLSIVGWIVKSGYILAVWFIYTITSTTGTILVVNHEQVFTSHRWSAISSRGLTCRLVELIEWKACCNWKEHMYPEVSNPGNGFLMKWFHHFGVSNPGILGWNLKFTWMYPCFF